MSAITVRANMRMMFDDRSANAAQTSYMSRLSRIEKAATASTAKSNAELIQKQRTLVANLERQNAAADERLGRRSKRIAQQIKANAESAAAALKPDGRSYRKFGGLSSAEYKQALARYEATINGMRMANEKYAASAKKLGITASTGAFSLGGFMENENAKRRQAINLMRRQVQEAEKGTTEHLESLAILKQMEDAHELLTQEERIANQVKRENNRLMREGQIMTDRGIAKNNALLREQMRIFAQINASISRITAQLTGAFMNALMMSGIALMTFGFRLQGVVSTFQEFEKELMNAQSIFQTTNDVLFSLSDEIVNFGTQYGISLNTASEGLYTLASAGLSASDSQEVLANTLKLSMAVQGDHDTIAKLTTQTIFGFGLEMNESAALTDKFAHAINMSLIEYQDLASAVKFAMPFFVSTGQNIDQLLGSLQVLTNRALEAGIAGRGLRQALAEFAQHAEDNTAAFRKMGVEITNTDGSFKLLTEIAREFKQAMGPAASDVDLMTTLLEDLNVRGATAFVHLVQNVEEFEGAVNDLQNSAGAATRMADIQQQSLANQIQVVKNALLAPFLLSDEVGRANSTMNTFGDSIHNMVKEFESFFLVVAPDGTRHLTDMGAAIRDTAIAVLQELSSLLKEVLVLFANMNQNGSGLAGVFKALMIPLKLLVGFVGLLGENGIQTIIFFKAMNSLLPLTEAHTIANMLAVQGLSQAEIQNARTRAMLSGAMFAAHGLMAIGVILMTKESEMLQNLGRVALFAAGAMTALAIAKSAAFSPLGIAGAVVAGGALSLAVGEGMKRAMTVPEIPMADTGMRMYDMGGGLGSRHFPVMVEPGETITSKTQNMLGGGGITLNIAGDIVTNDADDFAERIAIALPEALRKQNDLGGI